MSFWREKFPRAGFIPIATQATFRSHSVADNLECNRNFGCIRLLITKILDGCMKIESFLPGLPSGNEFGLGGRQREIVLTVTADKAQAPGCRRSSCRSVRIGRGGDRCNQQRS